MRLSLVMTSTVDQRRGDAARDPNSRMRRAGREQQRREDHQQHQRGAQVVPGQHEDENEAAARAAAGAPVACRQLTSEWALAGQHAGAPQDQRELERLRRLQAEGPRRRSSSGCR